MYACMHVCRYVRMYVCTYVCMYVCMSFSSKVSGSVPFSGSLFLPVQTRQKKSTLTGSYSWLSSPPSLPSSCSCSGELGLVNLSFLRAGGEGPASGAVS